MNRVIVLFCVSIILACGQKAKKGFSAQEIVNESIAVSGGELYTKSTISFEFRDRTYVMERKAGRKVLKRISQIDSNTVLDVKLYNGLQRFVNDSLVYLPDSMSNKYGNSVNSVHYFAYLPYGLNDPAVNKKYLGESRIKGENYHKIQVTFNKEGGGDDYDDIYVYWFNTTTLKPDYLAYEFHVDGGGKRFRQAYNERYVNGVRFVDYNNYKPLDPAIAVQKMDDLFMADQLELLSQIELRKITVLPGNYN
ncbi:DUF6503 family protein [Ulvibacterium sp.]|uniref:DUF6503 family protein n=1 Tax=Ulvibacterium sp. TaxID=2665914 RepID=UPI002613CF2C|nr:DUF6503 family protein [Ulvibacterium sp.]